MSGETSIFGELLSEIEQSGKEYDVVIIRRAYEYAYRSHGTQKRVSGEPYVVHPVRVSEILVKLGMDTETIVAALLHDVVEDTEVTLAMLEKAFGKEVGHLVNGVTKLDKIPYSSREEQQAENVRKMLLAMAKDVRVIIIKLADRLHNLRTISVMPEQKRRDKALETMEVFAPLAHRLGIRTIKEELEDLALRYLDPIGYQEIEHALELKKEERDLFIKHIKERITTRLVEEEHLKIRLDGRVKSIYGIYRKTFMHGRSMEEVYDIYAVRVIVDSLHDCYAVLGSVHDMFRPIPNRFKDYISTPKPNLYQSLHTTVLDKEGIPFEIQIRTKDMHNIAEYGIAAHWKYKEGVTKQDSLDERLMWVRQLLEQQGSDDKEDIVRSIKTDLSTEEQYVFTPRGDVINLPRGATVIDFAYAIHSQVGNRMTGGKIDGRIVSLDTEVKTGNIVEILTTRNEQQGPNRNWLKIVKTNEARNKIRSWFKKERREENILEGRLELEHEFKRNKMMLESTTQMQEFLLALAKRQHFENLDDFFAAIGYGGISLSRIMPRVKDDFQRLQRTTTVLQSEPDSATADAFHTDKGKGIAPDGETSYGIIVEGITDCKVKLSRCCNPLPGDDIVGYVTIGHGLSIHKRDCVNVRNSMLNESQRDRWVRTRWGSGCDKLNETFQSTIDVYAEDRPKMIVNVSMSLANMDVDITSINVHAVKGNHVVIQVTVNVKNKKQLDTVMRIFRRISGVVSVNRTMQ